jgi:hypothetical protein
MSASSYGHTAHYRYIDDALKLRWKEFIALEREIMAWEPKPLSAFAELRESELARVQKLNPGDPVEELAPIVDGQIRSWAAPGTQFHVTFDARLMCEYVIIVNLAHALSEAIVNAVLAIGLMQIASEKEFVEHERTDFKEKWLSALKRINPQYAFPRGTALHETLTYLAQQRNALVHYKIELEVDGKIVLEGSDFTRLPADKELAWLRRFYSLPYDLAAHAFGTLGILVLPDRGPIAFAEAHRSVFAAPASPSSSRKDDG